MSNSLSHSGIWRKKLDAWARWMQFSDSRTRTRNLCCSDLLFDICFISPGLVWWWHSLTRSRKSSALSLRCSTIHHATRRKGRQCQSQNSTTDLCHAFFFGTECITGILEVGWVRAAILLFPTLSEKSSTRSGKISNVKQRHNMWDSRGQYLL